MAPALTFDESCCDGGETGLDDSSCQPCGCDKRAGWTCAVHQEVKMEDHGREPNRPMYFDRVDVKERETRETITTSLALLGVIDDANSAQWRKERPLATGVLDYFPDALLEVAYCSFIGNKQHHDGKPLHWDKSKSTDEADACVRHLMERGKLDSDGVRHSAKAAWRALANLQREIEGERGA